MKKILICIFITLSAITNIYAQTNDPLNNNYYGKLTPQLKQLLMLNEQHHLDKAIKNAQSGKIHRYQYAIHDFQYILYRWPNHPKALVGATDVLLKLDRIGDIENMYDKAIKASSDTPETYVLFANYLYKTKDYNKAKENYLRATQLNPNYAEAHYNLGITYLAQKKEQQAVKSAKMAYQLGYPLPGLRIRLEKLNLW